MGHILYDHALVGDFVGENPMFLEYSAAIAEGCTSV